MKWIGQHIWDLTSRFRGISIFEKAIKLLKSDGSDGGVISMTGNDMVLSNTAGDVLIGSTTYQVGGDQDIFIGDGINSVDLVFEQSGAIKGYDGSVNLTIGGGGGTITFADKVNFVGGGIENEFQFNNLTIDGNFELSPITTTTSGGVLNGGFLNPAAEAKQVHMPQVLNDLAGFNHWGTVTVTGLYKTRTGSPGSYAYSNPVLPSDFASAFDGTSSTAGSWYSDNGASGTVQGEGVITLEWTNEATYGLWFGLVFGSDSFVPSRIKMEAYQTDVGWRTFADLTNVSHTDIGNIILRQIDGNSGTGQATNKLRFTLGHKNSGTYSYFRIHTIYLANYAQGNNNLSGLGTDRTRGYHYLERYRPNYAWGHFYPGQTTTYNLGGSSYRWAIGYFNSLDVAQSLNIAGSISASASVGNLNVSAGIGQDLEYGSTAVTTLRFDSDRWRLYAGGTSSELMTVQENGNVGIGTTSPASPFHVYENTSNTTNNAGLTIENDGSGDAVIQFLLTGDRRWVAGIDNSDGNKFKISQTTDLGGGDAPFVIDTSGNVSIGTQTTNSLFHVNAADGVMVDTYIARIQNQEATAGDNFGLYVQAGSNSSDISFRVTDKDANEYLRVRGDGNVGIGTTSPSEKLEVAGSIKAGGIKIQDTNGGRIGFNRNTSNGAIYNNSYGAFQLQNNGAGYLELQAYNSSGGFTGRLTMLESNGNIGIGTTSPTSKLQVDGNITSTSQVSGTTLYGNHPDGNGSSLKLGRADNSNYWLFNHAGNDLRIYNTASSGSDILLGVDASGNAEANKVGIGTATPGEKLEVAGNVKLSGNLNVGGYIHPNDENGNLSIYGGNNTTNDAHILLHGDSNYWGSLELNYGYDATNSFLKISQGSNEHLRITNGGKVGIGTATPSEKLEVNGNVQASSYKISGVTVLSGSANVSLGSSGATGTISLNTHTSTALYVAGDDNVGIGTTSPHNKAHITSSGNQDGLLLDLSTGSSGDYTGVYFKVDNNTTNAYKKGGLVWERTGSYNEGRFHFLLNNEDNTNNVDLTDSKFTILSTGNVGIGTTSPSEKLEVNGKIKATDINFSGLPTSSAGLSSGDVWNDGGTLKIVS